MGIGAVFGAMNTMYAIVSQRTREIGTLRALGFSRFSILFSFVTESVFLAFVGGVLGCLLAFPCTASPPEPARRRASANWHSPSRSRPPIILIGNHLRCDDGASRRTAAGGARLADADYQGVAGGVSSN